MRQAGKTEVREHEEVTPYQGDVLRDIMARCAVDRLIFDERLYEPLTFRRRTQWLSLFCM